MQIDLRVSQLLNSRLCHDLVGASGAVSAGLELMNELGLDAPDADSSLAMTVNSAGQLASRLAFFRMAFGSGGGTGGPPLMDARALTSTYMADYGMELDWPAGFDGIDGGGVSSDGARLLMNMVLMGKESLPRGGKVNVRLAAVDGGVGMAVTANGVGATVRDATRAALVPGTATANLTPHTVQAYFTAALAMALGSGLEVTMNADEVRLAAWQSAL